jgi:hypothetical protein
MPTIIGSGSGSPPVNILVGRFNADTDITALVPWDSIRIEETGNQAAAVCDLQIVDKTLALTAMRAEWRLLIQMKNPVTFLWQPIFRGFIRAPRPEIQAIYGNVNVSAYDVGTLLDRCVIQDKVRRDAADDASDKARIAWLFGGLNGYDGARIAQPLLHEGLDYTSKVQALNTSMPEQTFPARLTLRQALERILGQSSDSADYFIDHRPRLWTFDRATMNAVLDAAPYIIDVTAAPAAGRVAPSDLEVEWDSDNLWTGFFVTAKKASVSGFYADSDPFGDSITGRMDPPYGVDLYGRRFTYLDAPDADTHAKAQRVVKAALSDTRNPVPRVTFSVEGTSCYDPATGEYWQGGQRVYIKSAIHGLNGTGTDSGPWAGSEGGAGSQLMPLRIKRVTTTFLNGQGARRMEVEAGSRRKVLFSPAG